MLPALFVSHGAPTLPFDDVPARDFLRGLGTRIGRPKAILCVSAHWDTSAPALNAEFSPLQRDLALAPHNMMTGAAGTSRLQGREAGG